MSSCNERNYSDSVDKRIPRHPVPFFSCRLRTKFLGPVKFHVLSSAKKKSQKERERDYRSYRKVAPTKRQERELGTALPRARAARVVILEHCGNSNPKRISIKHIIYYSLVTLLYIMCVCVDFNCV